MRISDWSSDVCSSDLKQLGEVLYGQMGLAGGKKGKTGAHSTDVNELERLAAQGAPIARLVMDWRQLSKLKSTYTDALQTKRSEERGVGKEGVRTCRSRCAPEHKKKK